MKKVFAFVAVAAAMLVAGTASAQLSVNAGYLSGTAKSHSEFTEKVLNSTTVRDKTESMGGGFYVGGNYNVEFLRAGGNVNFALGVAPGIYFNYISKKNDSTYSDPILGDVTITNTTSMMNVNIPILVNAKLSFGDDFAVFAFAGPDIVFGISAKGKSVTKYGSTEKVLENDLYKKDDGADKPEMTRFDMGLMFGAGVQFTKFRVELGYELGLLNRLGEKERSTNVSSWKGSENINRFFVGVGYAL